MSGSHRGNPRGSLRLLSVTGSDRLGLATAPAHASPLTPPAPHDARRPRKWARRSSTSTRKLGYQSAIGAGTGIVIDGNGVVLTNNHVIAGATNMTASPLALARPFPATVIGYDRKP